MAMVTPFSGERVRLIITRWRPRCCVGAYKCWSKSSLRDPEDLMTSLLGRPSDLVLAPVVDCPSHPRLWANSDQRFGQSVGLTDLRARVEQTEDSGRAVRRPSL